MVGLSQIFERLQTGYSKGDLLWITSSVSRFHRVQGCSELEQAADFIVNEVLDVRNLEVRVYRYSYSKGYGIHKDVVGWDIFSGFTQILPKGEVLSSFPRSSTAVAAHSPPGDVEAEVVYVGNGLRPDLYKGVEDKIVLSHGPPYVVYRMGCARGAAGFIFFRKRVHENAVPYVGLFLSRDDVGLCRAPATTIPRRDALRIVDEIAKGNRVRARVYVESAYRSEAYAPVVEISLGDGDSEVHLYAHLCHPAGTVNDNVSGVASILELVRAVDRAVDGGLGVPRGRRLVFALFPEYYGSLPYLMELQRTGRNVEFGVNLDMVGEKQWLTNSTLHLVRPLGIISNPRYEALVLKALLHALSKSSTFSASAKAISYRFDVSPYDSGSDHDLYLQLGAPSVAVSHWPDEFYHSDMDTVEVFDPDLASAIALAAGAAAYSIASGAERLSMLKRLSDYYADYVRSYTTLKADEFEGSAPSVDDGAVYRCVAPMGVVTTRLLVDRLGVEGAVEAMADLENRFLYHLFSSYIPLLSRFKPVGVSAIRKHVAEDYGWAPPAEDVEKVLGLLKGLGIVERV